MDATHNHFAAFNALVKREEDIKRSKANLEEQYLHYKNLLDDANAELAGIQHSIKVLEKDLNQQKADANARAHAAAMTERAMVRLSTTPDVQVSN